MKMILRIYFQLLQVHWLGSTCFIKVYKPIYSSLLIMLDLKHYLELRTQLKKSQKVVSQLKDFAFVTTWEGRTTSYTSTLGGVNWHKKIMAASITWRYWTVHYFTRPCWKIKKIIYSITYILQISFISRCKIPFCFPPDRLSLIPSSSRARLSYGRVYNCLPSIEFAPKKDKII